MNQGSDHTKELQRRIAVYGDQQAYQELFYLYYKPLLRFANAFVRSHEMSEEIVSDVFIRIWERRSQLSEITNLKVYLYVSVRNMSLKYLLKKQKQASVSLDDLQVELESQHHDPEQLLLTAELMNRVARAIDNLPPRCKMVYKLIKEDGLRYREVSEILDISIKTIDNQLAIALKKIGKAININLRKLVCF
ncbi:RNA polymerase sigma-70 factor [Pseudoflavitalea rhizosphaerae]|uniref:RNA polymerase sigma-70 factor n=1 Tax=Pseudoflavitalea rhizosphaerae TaxID=1884793 RepID=UPI000F8F442D|nr:RNA polymerase sigma-70 factor [Pseudoflavitalea rhizosphaerae]